MTSSRRFHAHCVGWERILSVACLLCIAAPSRAADVAFRRHVINAQSEYSTVAVLDVNRDGKQDILCGGFWYEAPTWTRHFVRDVERIRGRFDGYSHLPMDVNGDGWTDVITVNYRSRSIRWMQHPGANFGPWSIHTVEEPGAMETGRLFDIDDDGRLDVLANGQQFAAWWEVRPGAPGQAPRWTRNELPAEVGGHGLGFGDINGDGRGDVVGPKGWAAAPQDRRKERWVWHPEFSFGRASLPVLVVDVDEDGDNDLVWTRAHGFGVYWMEQSKTAEGNRTWTHHTIDSSWSQCHSPLWADMDGDGQRELIAGKRYMAHEGLDPGAYDPLVSYRYQFDEDTKTWQRWVISEGEKVGFGLDPKVIDLDDDGDLDLVVCGRSGLYWLENEGPFARSRDKPPAYGDADLMIVKDAQGNSKPVKTPFDWGRRRAHIVASVERELGSLPRSHARIPLDVRILQQRVVGDMTHQAISYQSHGGRVKADVWLPKQDIASVPGLILVNQADVTELVSRGYVCVVLELSDQNDGGHTSQSLASLKTANVIDDIWKCMRAVDLLESLPQVNGERIGCVGNGIGAQLAFLTAVLDQRIVATWCRGEFPIIGIDSETDPTFTFTELIAAISPRAVALRVPVTKPLQEIEALKEAVERASVVFGLNRTAQPPTIEAESPAEASRRLYEWLDGRLKRRAFFGRPRTRRSQ